MKAGTGSVGGVTSDIAGLHLGDQAEDEAEKEKFKEQPGLSMKQEELLAKVSKDEEESDKKNISLIVVGKDYLLSLWSTLTGRSCRRWEIDVNGSFTV